MPLPRTHQPLRIAHLIPYLGRAQGGPVFDLAALVAGQVSAGSEVNILSTRCPGDGEAIAFGPAVKLIADDQCKWGAFRRSPALWKHAREVCCDVIHSHCLWTDVNRLAMSLARTRGIPHVLTPCGMLGAGALRRRWWKKAPIKLWFQVRALREAQCLQAQSELEYEQIRGFGLRNPIAIIPAAVALPANRLVEDASFRSRHGIPPHGKLALYLGRLHPVKGLSRLIEAWARLRVRKDDWRLVLAGPDEDGFAATLKAQVAAANCVDSIHFIGSLDENEKWKALAAAEFFVMPSDFENFGISILEALACDLPVVTTTGTPWRELQARRAGWWVTPDTKSLREALEQAMALPDAERRIWGANAASLARQFAPEIVVSELMEVYQWLLGGGPRPNCVHLD